MNDYIKLDGGSRLGDFYEQIKAADSAICVAFNQRNQKLQNNESVYQLNKQLAAQIDNVIDSIKLARNLLNQTSNLSPIEIQRQKKFLDEYQIKSENYRKALQTQEISKLDIPESKLDFNSKSNVEMVQMQKQYVQKQNDTIDKMIDTTGRMQINAKNINLALDEDKVVLRRLNENVEQATHEIKVTDSNLKSLLSYTNDCCLWTTIIIEFMIFVFLVIY